MQPASKDNHLHPGSNNWSAQPTKSGKQPFPSILHCNIASGALCPVWDSPVQEGYLHTALVPMDSCQDGQGGSHTRKDRRDAFSFEKSRQKVGLTAFYNQLIREYTEDAARLS